MLHRTKTWVIRAVQVAFLCALILGLTSPVVAKKPSPLWPRNACTQTEMPGHGGETQHTVICVPRPQKNWNDVLVVYAHGYVAPQKPLALPEEELGRMTIEGQSLVEYLLDQGFAFATTSYSKNGYAVEHADTDLDILVTAFRNQYPERQIPVILVGASEGGLITVQQIEQDFQIYQGGLALCGPVGGMPYQVNFLGDFRVVFDYFFPDVFGFGAAQVPDYAYLDWESDYAPTIVEEISTHPLKTYQLFNVTDAALDWLNLGDSAVETSLQILFYSIFGMNDAIGTTGGVPYDNMGTWYSGSMNDDLLNQGLERVEGDQNAIAYTGAFYEPTGHVNAPLVTLHNLHDPAVPYRHELIYAYRVLAAGTWEDVTLLPALGYGHCAFSGEQVLGAFGLLLQKAGAASTPTLEQYRHALPEPLSVESVE